MTAHVVPRQWADAIAFNRLHALVARGYQPRFDCVNNEDFSCVELVHPRIRAPRVPPRLVLWSNGILSTDTILWPDRYVPQEDGPPDWQRFIDVVDGDRFSDFVSGIARPSLVDTHLVPAYREAKTFVARLLFGSSLCVVLAGGVAIARSTLATL